MGKIELKEVSINELIQLQEIGKKTFAENFSSGSNSEENMQEYLDEKFSVDRLKTELSGRNFGFYFAVLDETVVGYLKINFGPSQTEL